MKAADAAANAADLELVEVSAGEVAVLLHAREGVARHRVHHSADPLQRFMPGPLLSPGTYLRSMLGCSPVHPGRRSFPKPLGVHQVVESRLRAPPSASQGPCSC